MRGDIDRANASEIMKYRTIGGLLKLSGKVHRLSFYGKCPGRNVSGRMIPRSMRRQGRQLGGVGDEFEKPRPLR
jgi:hypothetical protein